MSCSFKLEGRDPGGALVQEEWVTRNDLEAITEEGCFKATVPCIRSDHSYTLFQFFGAPHGASDGPSTVVFHDVSGSDLSAGTA